MPEATNLQSQLRALYESGLNSSVVLVGNILLSSLEKKSRSNISSKAPLLSESILPLALCGKVYFQNQEYKRALTCFRKAIYLKDKTESVRDSGKKEDAETNLDNLKYNLFCCYSELGDDKNALSVLASIPFRQRTLEVHRRLGTLYDKGNMDRAAISCYKEVLRKAPLAIDCAIALIHLGVGLSEITPFYANLAGFSEGEWNWVMDILKAESFDYMQEFRQASALFRSLESTLFYNNTYLLLQSAHANWKVGDAFHACHDFERVHRADPFCIDKMDIYAAALKYCSEAETLSSLGKDLMDIDPSRPEPWIAVGRYCELTEKKENAIVFAQRAIEIITPNSSIIRGSHSWGARLAEAYNFKGTILLASGKPDLAVNAFRDAFRWTKRDFFIYSGLMESYIALSRIKEAYSVATEAKRMMPNNPRCLALVGTVLSHTVDQRATAKQTLEVALAADPRCLDAVVALVQLNVIENRWEETIRLLKEHLNYHNTDFLHTRLADVLTLANDFNQHWSTTTPR
eukprot:Sdes_comp19504_c0_seq1m11025